MVKAPNNVCRQCLLNHQCLLRQGSTRWDRAQTCMILLHLRHTQHLSSLRRFGLPIVSRGLLDRALFALNVAESGVTIPNVGLVISSGVHRRVSTDIRTGSTVNALQKLSKAQLLQQLGRSGRTDCGIHITMMSRSQYLSQVRSTDLAQLEETNISPMTQQSNVNHGHPDGDLITSILAYEWFLELKTTYARSYDDWRLTQTQEWRACTKVGLITMS